MRESHHEVLPDLFSDLGRGYLPTENLTVVHFDAHSDLSLPAGLTTSTLTDRVALCNSVCIADWLLPLAALGVVGTVVWYKPSWAGQMPDGDHRVVVGVDGRTGAWAVSSELDYYTEEGAVDEEVLGEKRVLRLRVVTVRGDGSDDPEAPLRGLGLELPLVLDVCLDYFATVSPWRPPEVPEETMEVIRRAYFPRFRPCATIGEMSTVRKAYTDALAEVVAGRARKPAERDGFLGELRARGVPALCEDPPAAEAALLSLFDRVLSERDGEPMKPFHDEFHACATLAELPVHTPADPVLNNLMAHFQATARLLATKTATITLARSADDGYTPRHLVDTLQFRVIASLTAAATPEKKVKIILSLPPTPP